MTFLDASYVVGIVDDQDKWHARARALQPRIRTPVTTDLVLVEAVTIIGARQGGKAARTLYRFFVDSCRVEYLDAVRIPAVMEEHLRYDGGLSVADTFSVVVMRALALKEIASFDDDFDKVKGIHRLH